MVMSNFSRVNGNYENQGYTESVGIAPPSFWPCIYYGRLYLVVINTLYPVVVADTPVKILSLNSFYRSSVCENPTCDLHLIYNIILCSIQCQRLVFVTSLTEHCMVDIQRCGFVIAWFELRSPGVLIDASASRNSCRSSWPRSSVVRSSAPMSGKPDQGVKLSSV